MSGIWILQFFFVCLLVLVDAKGGGATQPSKPMVKKALSRVFITHQICYDNEYVDPLGTSSAAKI